ncbi:hypothetical protein, partial [Streptomyces sp. P17]|uniref:hypothetical protein n=1 Tax=Streptomyces sp. P17 TaxID=3074716 RepID=UPI0028F424F5
MILAFLSILGVEKYFNSRVDQVEEVELKVAGMVAGFSAVRAAEAAFLTYKGDETLATYRKHAGALADDLNTL